MHAYARTPCISYHVAPFSSRASSAPGGSPNIDGRPRQELEMSRFRYGLRLLPVVFEAPGLQKKQKKKKNITENTRVMGAMRVAS